MTVRIGSLELDHPVLNASGTLDPLAAEAAGLTICRELADLVPHHQTPSGISSVNSISPLITRNAMNSGNCRRCWTNGAWGERMPAAVMRSGAAASIW